MTQEDEPSRIIQKIGEGKLDNPQDSILREVIARKKGIDPKDVNVPDDYEMYIKEFPDDCDMFGGMFSQLVKGDAPGYKPNNISFIFAERPKPEVDI